MAERFLFVEDHFREINSNSGEMDKKMEGSRNKFPNPRNKPENPRNPQITTTVVLRKYASKKFRQN